MPWVRESVARRGQLASLRAVWWRAGAEQVRVSQTRGHASALASPSAVPPPCTWLARRSGVTRVLSLQQPFVSSSPWLSSHGGRGVVAGVHGGALWQGASQAPPVCCAAAQAAATVVGRSAELQSASALATPSKTTTSSSSRLASTISTEPLPLSAENTTGGSLSDLPFL